ncbi:uncharacterized protein DAT39_013673 [Clarias magur]|uniref:Uncharacterized protein n=1 Tax=Clarias magur TaxID=1594786 RepID=A0A8J4TVZ6_CLAMG|nr:uncharacterized protein DAT39_013673 [Clarias magur]
METYQVTELIQLQPTKISQDPETETNKKPVEIITQLKEEIYELVHQGDNSHGDMMNHFIKGQHVSLCRLAKRVTAEHPIMKYLIKEIPPYPTPVEFWVTDVAHVTEETGFKGILNSELFRPPNSEFLWWGLKMNKEEIRSAEKRYMKRNFLNNAQKPFLEKFTTSPLFQLQKSRFGNYNFTFPFTELMERYKEQNCAGEEPVLRVYGTIPYKQQIVYTMLIHSPEDKKRFREYPLRGASEWVRYQDGKIIWKAQAICGTHWYQFVSGEAEKLNTHVFYVWDQVSLVFHLPKGTKGLRMPRQRLIEALEACELDGMDLSGYQGSKNKKERFLEAKIKVNELKEEKKRR